MTVGIELIVRLVESRANMRDILIGIGLIPIDRVFVEISGQSVTVDRVFVVMANGLCLSGLFVGDFLFDDSLIDIALLVLAELFANTASIVGELLGHGRERRGSRHVPSIQNMMCGQHTSDAQACQQDRRHI